MRLLIFALVVSLGLAVAGNCQQLKPYSGKPGEVVDASSLLGKVICGYQGWFACPGDPLGAGWIHWGRNRNQLAPDNLTVDMWPDMSDYSDAEKYPAAGFTYPDGSQAYLFSSQNQRTVLRHFEWMKQYGLDGAEVQRFVVGLRNPATASSTRVLKYARQAAEQTGRVFCVGYDLSGTRPDEMLSMIKKDWAYLVDDLKITQSPQYLRQNGKPVVTVFGFYSSRFDAAKANEIIDLFKHTPGHQAYLIGSGEWWWRKEPDAEWAKIFRRFDCYKPWNVGNTMTEQGKRYAATGSWADDIKEAKQSGVVIQPVIYPGFSWDNLKRQAAGSTGIPRLKGEFFWRQFVTATNLGVKTAFIAMFDEVDEGTAIFKVTNNPPVQAHFATYEGLPSDFYLKLAGAGTRLLHGEEPVPPAAAE